MYSELLNVDPDRNYLTRHSQTICSYHNDSSFNDAYKNCNNRFFLFHANIRSIPRNLDQLTFYLQNLNIDFSVIALSKTWLKPCNKDIYYIPGYVHKSVMQGIENKRWSLPIYKQKPKVRSNIKFVNKSGGC